MVLGVTMTFKEENNKKQKKDNGNIKICMPKELQRLSMIKCLSTNKKKSMILITSDRDTTTKKNSLRDKKHKLDILTTNNYKCNKMNKITSKR